MSLLFRDVAGPSLSPCGSVACVGAFDGVHLGHLALLERVTARARAQGLREWSVHGWSLSDPSGYGNTGLGVRIIACMPGWLRWPT